MPGELPDRGKRVTEGPSPPPIIGRLMNADEPFLKAEEIGERLRCSAQSVRRKYGHLRKTTLRGGRWLWSEVHRYELERASRSARD